MTENALCKMTKQQDQHHTNVWCERTSSSVSRLKPSCRSSNRSTINTFAYKQKLSINNTMTTKQQQQQLNDISKQTNRQTDRQMQWYG